MFNHKINFLIVATIMLVFLMGCQSTKDSGGESSPQPSTIVPSKPPEGETEYPGPAGGYPPPISLPLVVYNPYPGPSEGLTNYLDWSMAEQAIMNGEISEVYQAHTLHVTLVKKDGGVLLSVEPAIDEVFRVLDLSGAACKDVTRITE